MTLLACIFIGLLAGLASGLFGVGGGTVFVPLLMLLCGFSVHMAIGTSIAAIVPTAIVAALRHHGADMVSWKTVAFLTVFAMLGAWFGAGLSVQMDVVLLRKIYAIFLFVIALKLFFE